MNNSENRRIGGIGWAVIAMSVAILFTCGFLTALVGIDYEPHELIALSLTPSDPVGLFKAHPEPFWHLLTYLAVTVFRCRVEIAAGIVSGLLIVVNKTPYLGQGSPNIWHNPTSIAVRPIALLVFVLVSSMVIKARREDFEHGIPAGTAVLTGLLLILSCLAKPSFVQVFYPAIFTLMVIWLIMYRGRNLKTALQLFLVCLPSLIVMILQFVNAFYSGSGKSGGLAIKPFVVAGARTRSIPISLLLLLAFPLLMLVITAVKKSLNWSDALAWLMLFWGLVWRLLLAEKGEREWHGNFSWGFMLASYLVWYCAVRNYLRHYFSEQMTGNKRGVGFVLATLVLALHLISGIYYIGYLVILGNGM